MDIYMASALKKGPGDRNNSLLVNQRKNDEGVINFQRNGVQIGNCLFRKKSGVAFFDYNLNGDLDLYFWIINKSKCHRVITGKNHCWLCNQS
jgi:hypothetical protein